jgi:uncharacterized membrane protein
MSDARRLMAALTVLVFCLTMAGLVVLAFSLTAVNASAQGRSGGAPGWGRGGPSADTTFNTPFGSGIETKEHSTGGWSGGNWGAGGQPSTPFQTPSGRPSTSSNSNTQTHTTGKR